MNIKDAQYYLNEDGTDNQGIKVTVDNDKVMYVPLNPNNMDYAEILKQVAEGTLTIKDAE
tara:strand:+ start:614 stop:793 length:180 start_codon:yes stop_codon:yes gene_type:complete